MADTKITIIDKATHTSTVVTGQDVSLSAASIIELPISHLQVKALARQGGDLVITTVDGDSIVVHGYFADGQTGRSDLVVQDDGGLWLADLSSIDALPLDTPIDPMAGSVFSSVDSVNPLLGPTDPAIIPVSDTAPADAAPAAADAAPAPATTAAGATDAAAAAAATTDAGATVADTTTDATAGASDAAAAGAAGTTDTVTAAAGDTGDASAADGGGGAALTPTAAVASGGDNDLSWLPIAIAGVGFATAFGSRGASAPPVPAVTPNSPTFGNISQNSNGTLTVTGTATPGDTVTVTFPDNTTGSVTVGSNGSYTVSSTGVETTGTVTAVDTNPQGVSSPPASQIWTDTTPPAPPSSITVTPNSDGGLTVSGHAEPGSTVTVTFPDQSTGTATAGSDGSFSVTTHVPQTSGTLVVTDTDQAGNQSQPTDVTYTDITPPVAVTPPTVTDNKDGTVTVSGGPGSAEAGSTITVQFPDGTTGSVTAGSDGSYSVTSTSPEPNGTITVISTDQAGNHSPSTSVNYTQSDEGVYITAIVRDTGQSHTDFITDDNTLIFVGALAQAVPAGDKVQISLDGGKTWNAVAVDGTTWMYDNTGTALKDGSYNVAVRESDSSGNAIGTYVQTVLVDTTPPAEGITISSVASATITGTLSTALNTAGGSNEYVQVSTDGGQTWNTATVSGTSWSYTTANSPLYNGAYTVEARVIDVAGNIGQTTIDKATVTDGPTPPNITITAIAKDTGESASDFITNDQNLIFTGGLSQALTSGQTAQISLDGGNTWHPVAVSGTTWTYDNTANAIPQGTYTIEAEVVSSTGQLIGTVASHTLVIDTTPPSESISITDIITNTGPVGGFTTSDNTLVFVGQVSQALASDEYVQVSLDGGKTWNTADVSGTLWTYDDTANALPDGNYTVEARIVDVAGNIDPNIASQVVTIQGGTPPTITIGAIVSDTGESHHDFITDDNTLMFTGTLAAALTSGQVAQISLDGGKTWTAVTTNGTTWIYDDTGTVLPDGSYLVEARVIDSTQAQVGTLATQTVLIDTQAPTEAVTITNIITNTGPVGSFTTSDNTLVFVGQVSPALNGNGGSNEYVQISLDGGQTWHNADLSGNTWTYDNTANALPDGNYTVEARIIDVAGNIDQNIASQVVTIKGGIPPVITIGAIVSDTGESHHDFITDDNTLMFTGALGAALTSGQQAQISLDGGKTWNQVSVNGTTWTYDDTGTALPDGSYLVEARVIDSTQTQVGALATQTVLIDTQAPTEAITITNIVTNTGPVGGFTTSDNTLIFMGQVSPSLNGNGGSNEYVQVSLDGGQTWHNADVSGNTWTYDNTGNALPDGNYTVEARIIDVAGNIDQNIASQVVTIKGGIPPAITIGAIVSDTGESHSDFITDDNTLMFTGALGAALTSGQQAQISLDGGKTWTAVTTNGTTWMYDDTGTALPDGSYLVEARVIDSTQTQVGAIATQTVLIDTQAPTEAITITNIITNTGPVGGFTTSDNTLIFMGQVSPSLNGNGGSNEYVQVSLDGGQTWHDADLSGNTWTYDNTGNALPDGNYTVEARIIDVAGNIDQNIASQVVTIKGGIPPVITIGAIISDTGLSPNDFITDDNTLIFTGTLGAALTSGQVAQISLDGGKTWTAVTTSGTTWTYDDTGTALKDGSYLVEAQVVDSSGHTVGAVATQTVLIDTTAPTEAVTITNIITNTGPVGGFTTSDNTLIFMGQVSPSLNGNGGSTEYVQVSLDGGQTWHNADLSGTTWTYDNTGTALKDGNYTVEARIIDVAGNVDQNIASQVVTIKGGTPPTITIDAISPDTGLSPTDFITDSSHLTFTGTVAQPLGTASGGVAVEISLDGGKTWTAPGTVTVTGTTWTYNDTAATLSDGTYAVVAKVVDASGSQVGQNAQQTVVVDTHAPTEGITIGGVVQDTDGTNAAGAFVTTDNTLMIYGTLSQPLNTSGGSTEYVQVSVDGGKDWHTATVSGTQWYFDNTDQPLANGTYTVEAQVVDVAGNVGQTATGTVIVNSTPPANQTAIAITSISQDTGISNTDFITDVNQQTINGTFGRALLAGESIQVSLDGGQTWNTATWNNTNLTWAYATPKLADGTYEVEARIGSTTTASDQVASQAMVIDTLPPTETMTVTGGGALPIQVPADGTISGTISSALANGTGDGVSQEFLQINLGDGTGWHNATTDGTAWTYTIPSTVKAGTYTAQLQIVDAAGNTDTVTASQQIQVGVPVATLVTITSVKPDTGASSIDFVTDTGHVTINGLIGQALGAGQTLQISTDGGNTWTVVPASGINGFNWQYTPPQGLADGTYNVQAEIVDATGTPIPGGVATQSLVIDSQPPTETVTIANGSNATYDTGTPTFTGTISAALATGTQSGVSAESLQISLDGGKTWNAASVNGTSWTYTPNLPLGNGTYTLQAEVVDLAGNVDTQIAKQTVTITGGSSPILITAITPDTGVTTITDTVVTNPYLNGGGTEALTVSGQLFAPLATGQSIQVSINTSGSNPSWVTLPASSVTTAANGQINWSYTPASTAMPTADGTYTVEAQIVDSSGNSSYVNTKTLILDTQAPTETAPITGISSDTGTSKTDFVTNVNTQTISGTLSAPLNNTIGFAETLQISVDGGNNWISVPSANIATSATGTTWSYSTAALYPNGLADHAYTLETRVIDQAGNVGPLSQQTLVIDTHAPTEIAAITAISNPTSTATPWVTTNGDVTISGTLSSALVSTTTAAGVAQQYLQISTDGGNSWTVIPSSDITTTASGTTWSYTVPAPLQAGSYNVEVQVADIAGNAATPVTQQIAIGNANETISNIVSIAPTAGGASDTNFIINTNQVTLSGTLTALSNNSTPATLTATQVVQVSVDGSKTWTSLPSADVTGSTWTYATSLLQPNGNNTVETRVYDTQSNTWSTVTTQTVLVDMIAPTEGIAITAISPDTGVQGDFITSNGALTISGTLTAALNGNGGSTETVQVSTDGGATWHPATVTGTTWSYTPTPLAAGSYQVVAEVIDAAGNIDQPAKQTVIITSTGPTETATITGIIPDTGGAANNFITSTTATHGQLTINGALSAPLATGDVVQISTDNGTTWHPATSVTGTTWSYVTTSLTDGTYQVQAEVVSAAGVSNVPATQTIIIDNTAPTEVAKLTAVSDGAVSGTGAYVTPDLNPVLSGTLSNTLSTTGSTEALQISLDGGQNWHTATVTGNTWTFDTTGLNLKPGSYSVVLEVIDSAGNIGTQTPVTVEINPTPQETIGSITSISPDTGGGNATSGYITSTATNGGKGALTVTGSITSALQANEGVEVTLDGGTTWAQAIVTGTTWTANIANVGDGDYTLTAQVYNTVTKSASQASTAPVLVDNTSPIEIPAITSITAPAGSQGTGYTTSAATGVVLHGTLNSPLNSDGGSQESLKISIDGGKNWTELVTSGANANGTYNNTTGQWSFDLPTLVTGANAVEVEVVDQAGNTSTAANQTVTVATPPTFTSLTFGLAPGNDDGTSATDNVTSIAAPTVTGSVITTDPNALAALAAQSLTVTLYIDTNGDGVPDAGDQILATVPVTGTPGNLTFTANLASMSPGTHVIEAALGTNGVYSSYLSGGTVQLLNGTGNKITISPTAPAETLTQPTQSLGLGYSMTAIGDFNGDGYTDYIVSAPRTLYGPAGTTTATVEYLLYGGPNGLPNISNLANLTPAQGFKITDTGPWLDGGNYGIQGLTVTDLGDINGDGLDDVAITSNTNDRTYVLFGQRGDTVSSVNLSNLETTANSTGFVIRNNGSGNYVGDSVAGVDVNGDGYNDIVVSSPSTSVVYVIDGHSGTWNNYNITSTGVYNATSTGGNGSAATDVQSITTNGKPTGASNSGPWLGGVIADVGDVNGDGYDDFVVTEPGSTTGAVGGTAALIFGGPNGLPTNLSLSSLTPSQGILLTSSQASEKLGGQTQVGGTGQEGGAYYAQYHSVTSLGDINGDGYTDFAIGSPGAINPTASGDGAGAVYVIYGTAAGVNWSNITLPTYSNGSFSGSLAGKGFVIYSQAFANVAAKTTNTASDLGYSVSNVGDVNGDGLDDFLIGAPMANNGAGAVFLVFGEAGGLPGASTGVVNLDALVAAGKTAAFGTPGTAIEYDGTSGGGTSHSYTNTYMGTDVTGGDFTGTGISSYSFSEWNSGTTTTNSATNNGQGTVYVYNGTTAYLTQSYTSGNDIMYAGTQGVGDAPIVNGVNRIATGTGNDWVHGIGLAADVVSGGAGNDSVGIVGTAFQRVDGGSGWNTLVFENSGMTLNLATEGLKVQNFEQFDLNNQTNNTSTDPQAKFTGTTTHNTLQLGLADVLAVSQAISNANATSTGANAAQQHMTIMGDGGSTVQLDGTSALTSSNWSATGATQTINGNVYNVYHDSLMGSNTAADLLIQKGVTVI